MASQDDTAGTPPHRDGAFWAAVRRDFDNGELTLAEICARHGLTASQFYRHRKAQNWPPRGRARVVDRARPARLQRLRVAANGSDTLRLRRRLQMIERLYAVLEQELRAFESGEIQSCEPQDGPVSAAERERSARTLTSLIRSFDKICEFDDKARQAIRTADEARQAGEQPDSERAGDADSLREEIARRLERLLAGQDSGRMPEPPQRG